MKVGLTGSSGFLGWHVRAFLKHSPEIEIVPIDRGVFEDTARLAATVSMCDVLVHLAGGRFDGDDEDGYKMNMSFTEKLIAALLSSGTVIPVFFSSSAAIQKDTPYGRAKRDASELWRTWGDAAGAAVSIQIIPHLFGEFAQPHHHTVSATFCEQLANDEPSVIQGDGVVEFVHVREVAARIASFVSNPVPEKEGWIHGTEIAVPELYARLKRYRDSYRMGIFPELTSVFDKQLFNMLYAAMFERMMPVPVSLNSDERGSLVEAVRSLSAGQSFFSITKPGYIRGEHYHTRKIERFMVVKGEATIKLRKLFDDRILAYKVSGARPVYIDMPTYYTHNIENTGTEDLTTLFWTNELYTKEDPDTIPEKVG